MGSHLRGREAVLFLHLGDQCPYARWFAGQARELAQAIGMEYREADITGRPDLASPHGAYFSMQVHVPGYPLLTAPRAAATMLALLERGFPEHCHQTAAPPKPAPAQPPAPPQGCLCSVRPHDHGWGDAVAGTVGVCLSTPFDSQQRAVVAGAKRRWLERLAVAYGGAPVVTVIRLGGQVAGFAELMPAAAAPVPIAGAGPLDMYLTCVHAAPDLGELRPALLQALQSVLAARPAAAAAAGTGAGAGPDAAVPAVWAVSGRNRPYPNGPAGIFSAAGFEVVAELGRTCLVQYGWDDLLLLRWPAHGGEALPVGLLLGLGDNVVTVPLGCAGGRELLVRGPAPGRESIVVAREDIPAGHKMSIQAIAPGLAVTKYGQPIGLATRLIEPGEHVHVHNLASDRARAGSGGEIGGGYAPA